MNLGVVKFLVGEGADTRANNDEALRNASVHGHPDVAGFLEKRKDGYDTPPQHKRRKRNE